MDVKHHFYLLFGCDVVTMENGVGDGGIVPWSTLENGKYHFMCDQPSSNGSLVISRP